MIKLLGLAFSFCFLLSCKAYQIEIQERVDIQYYETTTDFRNNNISEVGYTKIIKQDADYLSIKDIFIKDTYKLLARAFDVWALRYEGSDYVNLRFAKEFKNDGYFVKLSSKGRFSTIIFHEDTSNDLTDNSTTQHGVLGFLIDEANKWGKFWLDENGNKKRILIIDTENLNFKDSYGVKNSKVLILARSNINKILKAELSDPQIKQLTFENVMNLITRLNEES